MRCGEPVAVDGEAGHRPVIASESDYPDGHVVPSHYHRRGQLLYGVTGVVVLTTPDVAWVMPPHRGMWIPAGKVHEVRMLGTVKKRNLYFGDDAISKMPDRCQVLSIPPLMRNLLAEAVATSTECDLDGRAAALMALILHEVPRLSPIALSLPLPRDDAMAVRCRAFLREPAAHDTIDQWADSMAISRRTFTRRFRRQTGLSFVEWRQQACLMAALPRLAANHSVTTIALDLGYENPAAFTTMFKRVLGTAPSVYMKNTDSNT